MSLFKYCFSLAFFCLTSLLATGQKNAVVTESLANVTDSLINSEIQFFTRKGSALEPKDPLKAGLIEVPISGCSDMKVHLSLSSFFSAVSTFISIYLKEHSSGKQLDSIFLVTHSHYWVTFPKEAYDGIFTSASCSFTGGKRSHFSSPYYKAFYSQNKRRLYIYMLCGTDTQKYEVTWVVVNSKYYTRILDNVD